MNQNTKDYFQQIYAVSYAYGEAKHKREREKEALIAADDWDGVQAWREREKQFPNPYTSGQMKAYWAFSHSSEIGTDDLVMDDSLWEREVKDFSDTLRAAGVTTFVLTNQSTGLMEDIHNLEAQGWHLAGTCKLSVKEYRYGSDRIEEHLGLRFEIKKEG